MAAVHFKTALDGADDSAKLHDLCSLTYKEQAVWFLNAFWEGGTNAGNMSDNAETIWKFVDSASTIDNAKAAGNELDEMEAHRFLEKADEAHTVLEMRNALRKTGALAQNERPKAVPLTHYLLFKYEVDWHKLVNAPQGDNSAQIAEAQDKLAAVQVAFDESAARDAEASAALKESVSREKAAVAREEDAKATEAEAVARENEAKVAEAPFKAAQEEVEAALAEVKAQEDAYNNKTETLKKQSEEGGVVSRNRAKVQLDAHLAEDPLPLRKAKITLEAALKKADKTRAPFQAATEKATAARAVAEAARKEAEAARAEAESARIASEEAKRRAEAAVEAAQAAVAEAEAYLEELKKNTSSGQGALWWVDRELTEKKKYMPVSKGGIR